jgi:hypothetical protein
MAGFLQSNLAYQVESAKAKMAKQQITDQICNTEHAGTEIATNVSHVY